MLYDKRWDAKVEAKPLSLDGLIAWLERQPAGDSYNWHDCNGGCLIAQYGFAVGIDRLDADCKGIDAIFGGNGGSYSEICGSAPFTFGAALKRALALRG